LVYRLTILLLVHVTRRPTTLPSPGSDRLKRDIAKGLASPAIRYQGERGGGAREEAGKGQKDAASEEALEISMNRSRYLAPQNHILWPSASLLRTRYYKVMQPLSGCERVIEPCAPSRSAPSLRPRPLARSGHWTRMSVMRCDDCVGSQAAVWQPFVYGSDNSHKYTPARIDPAASKEG